MPNTTESKSFWVGRCHNGEHVTIAGAGPLEAERIPWQDYGDEKKSSNKSVPDPLPSEPRGKPR